jgi:diguanylate cyclase (GGDEF)-like protein
MVAFSENGVLFKLTYISIAIFIATIVNIFVTISSWRRRNSRTGVYFNVAMIAITWWTLTAGLDYSAVSTSLKVFFAKLEILGYMSAAALFAAFSLSYAGFEGWLRKIWIKILLIGIPALNILLVWTNDLHHWIWLAFEPSKIAENVIIFEHGPGFIWLALSGYILLAIILFSLLSVTFRGSTLARKQARLLLFALLIPVVSNLFYLLDIFAKPGVDWSSITFSITGLIFLSALNDSQFLQVIPVARNAMIERMSDGVLILDSRGYLVDLNPVAMAILGLRQEDLWTPFQTALRCWPSMVMLLEDPVRLEAAEMTFGNPTKVYDLHLTRLKDRLNRSHGLLVVMREITEHKQAKAIILRSEAMIRLRLRLWEFAAMHPVDELMQMALDEIGQLTGSPIGFYHFIEEDQKSLTLRAWSTRTRTEFCKAEGEGMHYSIDQAGVWVDCVHAKKPVIHNDYASLPHKKGMPEGHAAVVRELVVPTLRDGRVVSILGVGNKPSDYDQQDAELVNYFADIIWTIVEQKKAEEQIHLLNDRLQLLAMTDELTGLANRRAFFQRGEEEIKKAQRYHLPLSLIMLDIDKFKKINDTFSHAAGDQVLCIVADKLRGNSRDVDLAARLGGEEFGILLPNTDGTGAARIAERIRQAIEESKHTVDEKNIQVTVSVGLTEYQNSFLNLDSLLRKADVALYQAKEQGRNQVVFLA